LSRPKRRTGYRPTHCTASGRQKIGRSTVRPRPWPHIISGAFVASILRGSRQLLRKPYDEFVCHFSETSPLSLTGSCKRVQVAWTATRGSQSARGGWGLCEHTHACGDRMLARPPLACCCERPSRALSLQPDTVASPAEHVELRGNPDAVSPSRHIDSATIPGTLSFGLEDGLPSPGLLLLHLDRVGVCLVSAQNPTDISSFLARLQGSCMVSGQFHRSWKQPGEI
jgi:hypothetical protein